MDYLLVNKKEILLYCFDFLHQSLKKKHVLTKFLIDNVILFEGVHLFLKLPHSQDTVVSIIRRDGLRTLLKMALTQITLHKELPKDAKLTVYVFLKKKLFDLKGYFEREETEGNTVPFVTKGKHSICIMKERRSDIVVDDTNIAYPVIKSEEAYAHIILPHEIKLLKSPIAIVRRLCDAALITPPGSAFNEWELSHTIKFYKLTGHCLPTFECEEYSKIALEYSGFSRKTMKCIMKEYFDKMQYQFYRKVLRTIDSGSRIIEIKECLLLAFFKYFDNDSLVKVEKVINAEHYNYFGGKKVCFSSDPETNNLIISIEEVSSKSQICFMTNLQSQGIDPIEGIEYFLKFRKRGFDEHHDVGNSKKLYIFTKREVRLKEWEPPRLIYHKIYLFRLINGNELHQGTLPIIKTIMDEDYIDFVYVNGFAGERDVFISNQVGMGVTWLKKHLYIHEQRTIFDYKGRFPTESKKLFNWSNKFDLPKVVKSLIKVGDGQVVVKMLKFTEGVQNDSLLVIPLRPTHFLLFIKKIGFEVDSLVPIKNCYVPIVYTELFSVEKKGIFCQRKVFNHRLEEDRIIETFKNGVKEKPLEVRIVDECFEPVYSPAKFWMEHVLKE